MGEVAALTTDHDRIAELSEQALAWAGRVVSELDRLKPGWSAAFLDDTYWMQTSSQYGDRHNVLNHLERRLAKLNELLLRLG